MILFLLLTMLLHGVGNSAESREDMEAKESKDEKNKENEKEQEPKKDEDESENDERRKPLSMTPKGVLEIPLMTSFSDGSNTSSESERNSSFGSSPTEKEGWSKGFLGDSPLWKNFCDQIKKKSGKKFPAIPFLGGRDFSRKNLRRRLGRNHSAEDSIECGGFAVTKPSWRNFTYKELAEATDDFSTDNLVGEGGHAKVYKGHLPDGRIVAVKKITKMEKNDGDRVADFLSELGIIAHVTHPNAAKLIGFSIENGLHLVLQYLQNGSLATLLHGSAEGLEWKIRYKVAIGIAEGLLYLHRECPRRIIHRDITASNILLTEDFEPQISDFGLAKWLPDKWVHHVVHPIEGTIGYMAPEYFMHGIVHEKIDVFAFGVLLLELITGRHAVDSSMQSLVMWAKPLLEENNVSKVVDPRLGGKYDVTELSRAMFTASLCLHHLPNMRPNMKKVVKFLKGENEKVDMKKKSGGGKSLGAYACDLEDYTSTTYQNELNRHMQLIMES